MGEKSMKKYKSLNNKYLSLSLLTLLSYSTLSLGATDTAVEAVIDAKEQMRISKDIAAEGVNAQIKDKDINTLSRMWSNFKEGINKMFNKSKETGQELKNEAENKVNAVMQDAKAVGHNIKDKAEEFANKAKATTEQVKDKAQIASEQAKEKADEMWAKIKSSMEDFWKNLKYYGNKAWDNTVGKLTSADTTHSDKDIRK